MAAYGAQRKLGKTDKQAQDYLLKLFKNVVSQDKCARDSLQTFNAGRGDVLLAYENEALFARSRGQGSPFVIPRSTILIENPIAVREDERAQAGGERVPPLPAHARRPEDFRRERLPAGRTRRSPKQFTSKFPARPGQFTIDQLGLGGWDKVQKRFFDPSTGIWRGSRGRSEVPPAEQPGQLD